jgi:hypothetical protein
VSFNADIKRAEKGKTTKHTLGKGAKKQEAKSKVDNYAKNAKAQAKAEQELADAKKKRLEYEEKLKKAEPKSKGGLTAAKNKAEKVELEKLNEVKKNSITLENDRVAATEAMASAYSLSND